MFKRISIFLIVLLTVLCFVGSANSAGLFIEKDAANTYIDYVDSSGTSIMLIDDTTGVTIASLTTVNTYVSMTLTSTVDASSLTTGSFTTPGGASIAKQLYLGDDLDMSVGTTGVYDITLRDTVNDALSIVGGTTDMMVFDTDTDAILIVPPLTVTGLVTLNGGLTLGASGAGFDVTFYGDTAGSDFFWNQDGDTDASLTLGTAGGTTGVDFIVYGETNTNYLHWDRSIDDLLLVGTSTQLHIAGTTASTNSTTGSLKTAGGLGVGGACFIAGAVEIGVDDTGTDFTVYGDTTLFEVMWDASGNTNGTWYFGTDTKGVDVVLYAITTGCGVFWDPNGDTNAGVLSVGASGGSAGTDVFFYGNANGSYMQWDNSVDDLLMVKSNIVFSGATTTPISMTSAATGDQIAITGTWGVGITYAAISIGDYSTPYALNGGSATTDNMMGIICHFSGDLGAADNAIPLFVKFTTTADADALAIAQVVYAGADVLHTLSDAYAVRAKMNISPAAGETLNLMLAIFAQLIIDDAAVTIESMASAGYFDVDISAVVTTGQVTGVDIDMNGVQVDSASLVTGLLVHCEAAAYVDYGIDIMLAPKQGYMTAAQRIGITQGAGSCTVSKGLQIYVYTAASQEFTVGISIEDGATVTAVDVGSCTTGIAFTGTVTGSAISMAGITLADGDHEIQMRTTVGTEKTIIASGSGTSDAEIVTDVGADSLIADGSLYMEITDAGGALWIKKADVWTEFTNP